MKPSKSNTMNMKELAASWGIDYQVFQIKKELVESIKDVCIKENISQRKLASMIDGLTQDRVSKIFAGQVGHLTIDKMVEILTALLVKPEIKTKKTKEA